MLTGRGSTQNSYYPKTFSRGITVLKMFGETRTLKFTPSTRKGWRWISPPHFVYQQISADTCRDEAGLRNICKHNKLNPYRGRIKRGEGREGKKPTVKCWEEMLGERTPSAYPLKPLQDQVSWVFPTLFLLLPPSPFIFCANKFQLIPFVSKLLLDTALFPLSPFPLHCVQTL